MTLRSPLGRVLGLGSAKEGASHWWWQRLTALALIPLSLWFVYSLVSLTGAEHEVMVEWVGSPTVATLLILFVAMVFHHAQLGLQVVLEDYVHIEWLRLTCLVITKFAAVFLGLVAVVAILRVALAG